MVKDMSQECTLRLDKSGLFFEVQFQSLIPTKHPYYVNVMEKDSTQKSQGVIQLCYEYAKLGQVHSLQQFPSRWSIPLELAWNFYWCEHDDAPEINPLFEDNTAAYCYKEEVRMDLPTGSRNISEVKKTENLGAWSNDDIPV